MTYLQFHLIFILPPLLVLAGLFHRRHADRSRQAQPDTWPIWAVTVIAFIYTTPWDNLLVMLGVWSYGTDRVIGTLGYVPLEEYAFFFLQPLLTGYWYRVMPVPAQPSVQTSEESSWTSPPALAGTLVFLIMTGLGLWSLTGERTLYLGFILSWAGPVGLFQWLLKGAAFRKRWRSLTWGIAVPTIYLWIADRVAIGLEIWTISPAYTTGWHLLGLPIEEAIFFLITNVMVVQGLVMLDEGRWVAGSRGFTNSIERPGTPP